MAIFGTLWDRQSGSRAGDDLIGVTLSTAAHSLPATNPEIMIPVTRSIAELAATALRKGITLFGLRGNASLNTVGFHAITGQSTPTVDFEVVSAVLHTVIR